MQDTSKRKNLKTNLLITLALVALGGSLFLLLYGINNITKGSVKVYNCSISEISPDIPLEVKEQCRKLRAESFQKDLQKPK